MKPNKLTLQGFKGILSGTSKESITLDLTTIPEAASLVAIVGPNGNGKSTIMDNLHPYRVMPSRSTTLGPGGFSYWDNISGTSALKDLEWEFGGTKYRSTLTFKLAGKTQKSDCYLFQWNEALADWVPVSLNDGTLSDGKSSTYDRCVETILGSPDLFFTSHFSAQSRKSLTDYGTSKIKALLASILNLNHYRELSAKAGQVGKILRFQLNQLQDEISQSRAADNGIATLNLQIAEVDSKAGEHATAEKLALERVDAARKDLAVLESKRDSLAKDAEERVFLTEQITRLRQNAETSKSKLRDQADVDLVRIKGEVDKSTNELNGANQSLNKVNAEIVRLNAVVAQKASITNATDKLALQQNEIKMIDDAMVVEQAKLVDLPNTRNQKEEAVRSQTKFLTSGTAKGELVAKLTETAGLIDTVPCKGSTMQSQCPLLAQANEAQNGLPGHVTVLKDMRSQYRSESTKIELLNTALAAYEVAESAIRSLNEKRKSISILMDALNKQSALAPILADAEVRLPDLIEQHGKLQDVVTQSQSVVNSGAEQIATITARLNTAIAEIETNLAKETLELNERIEKLAKPVTEAEITTARNLVEVVMRDVDNARAMMQSVANQRVTVLAKIEAFNSIKQQALECVAEADRLGDEIAKWKLIEKGMGNDGLVALSIDDAGPEIARIANELLNECYEGRFAVRLDTQNETQAGNLRETFDVMVADNHRGEDKSLSIMSGGERVWVNECLTRAIALYVGQSNSTQHQTLFSDESDGPLDPERKRQFMQMKRTVLKLGNYQREYFISQTEELWQSADHVVYVNEL